MIPRMLGAAARNAMHNATRSIAMRMRGGKPSRRQIEAHKESKERALSAEEERKFRRSRKVGLESVIAEQRGESFLDLGSYFNYDGLLGRNRAEVARLAMAKNNPDLPRKYEARLLFTYALNAGIITDSKKASRQFSEWLRGVDLRKLSGMEVFREASPEVLKYLKEHPLKAFGFLRLNRNAEHSANQAIERIIGLNRRL